MFLLTTMLTKNRLGPHNCVHARRLGGFLPLLSTCYQDPHQGCKKVGYVPLESMVLAEGEDSDWLLTLNSWVVFCTMNI